MKFDGDLGIACGVVAVFSHVRTHQDETNIRSIQVIIYHRPRISEVMGRGSRVRIPFQRPAKNYEIPDGWDASYLDS